MTGTLAQLGEGNNHATILRSDPFENQVGVLLQPRCLVNCHTIVIVVSCWVGIRTEAVGTLTKTVFSFLSKGGTMKKRTSLGTLLATIVLMVTMVVPPAHAAVAENGIKRCTASAPFSYLKYTFKGKARYRAPGSYYSRYSYNYSNRFKSRYASGARGGGYWVVAASVDLNQYKTYAYCRNFT